MRPFAPIVVAMSGLVAGLQPQPAAAQLTGSFLWDDTTGQSDPDKPLRVHYRTPADLRPDTPIWFVLHGASRNADDYRTYLGTAPAAVDALVIAPEFNDEDWAGSRQYSLGNVAVSESNTTPRPSEEWSFSKIEALFDFLLDAVVPDSTVETYSMYGHSAGAQFVHRYLMWEPDARVKVAVAANAGWYTLPARPEPLDAYPHAWPYSLTDAPDAVPTTPIVDPLPSDNIATAFDKRLVVLLGEEDVQRTSSLRQTPEADDQGPHRFARGQFFFDAAKDEAERLDLPFNWALQTVPGVAHSGSQMAIPAAVIMRLADAETGDFNADGVIDAADYAQWQSAYGSRALAPGLGPDGNGDGVVDAADYSIWRDAAAVGDVVATPEPAAGLLAIAAVVGAYVSRTRWRLGTHAGTALLVLVASLPFASMASEAVILFGGDTSHGENYQQAYAASGGEDILAARGYDDAFKLLGPLATSADLVVLNLETPLTTREESPLVGKDYYHWSDPKHAVPSLQRLGVDAVSLANNHTLDFGASGLHDTLNTLRDAEIVAFGAGVDSNAAGTPYITELGEGGSIKLAVLGAFERRASYEAYNFYAKDSCPGVNPLDLERLASQIAAIRKEVPDAFVVVTPHWGRNYIWRSNHQREFAEQIIMLGADMIVGHGAHRMQEIERIKGKWVFYSIGNFVFNSAGRFAKLDSPPYSLPIHLRLQRDGDAYAVAVRAYPIVSDNQVTGYQPRHVRDEEMQEVRRLLLARDSDAVLREQSRWSNDAIGPFVEVRSTSAASTAPPTLSPTSQASP